MTAQRFLSVRTDAALRTLPTACIRAGQTAVALLVVGALVALGPQSPPQAAAAPGRQVDAQPEELQAMEPASPESPQAVGGGLECKDAFIDVNIALGQRIVRNVFCPADTVAVSGGATATINTGLYINATGPTSGLDVDPNKWFTSVENISSLVSGIGPSVRFYARCCRVGRVEARPTIAWRGPPWAISVTTTLTVCAEVRRR